MKLRGIREDPPRSGRYVIRFADAAKKYHREWCDSLEEAIQRYEMRIQQVEDGVFDASTIGRWSKHRPAHRTRAEAVRLVADVIDEVMAEANATLRSAKTIAIRAREWKRELAGRTLEEVTVEDILRWRRRKMNGGSSNSTCNRYVAFLRRVYNHAIACGYTQRNPAASSKRTGLSMLSEDKDEERVLSPDEQAALRQVMRPRDFLIVCLAIETGMRRSNLFGCRRDWIDLERRRLRIPGSEFKTKRTVTIYLNAAAVQIIEALLEMAGDSEWLLPSTSVPAVHMSGHRWVQNQWRRALRDAGIPWMRLHDLRGTMATRMLEAGATLEEVRIQGGWSNYAMVQRYARIVESHRRETSERAGSFSLSLLPKIGSDSGSEKVVPLRKRRQQ